MTSWYDTIPKSLIPKYHNPSFNNHKLSLPFRICVTGSSGSGKTTLALEVLHRCSDTFGLIVLCVKFASEPLYEYLRTKIKPEQIQVYEDGIIPPIEKFQDEDDDTQILMIFDDLVVEKNQRPIISYFIRGRKIAGGISMMYLTQSYFQVPKTIRLQCNYIFLKKLGSTRDLKMILRDFSFDLTPEELYAIYEGATEERKDFLLIDLQSEMENRFRKNFLEIIPVPKKSF